MEGLIIFIGLSVGCLTAKNICFFNYQDPYGFLETNYSQSKKPTLRKKIEWSSEFDFIEFKQNLKYFIFKNILNVALRKACFINFFHHRIINVHDL